MTFNEADLVYAVLVIIFLLYFLFPPRRVNRIYGYRTFASMQDDNRFKLANQLASKYMILGMVPIGIMLLMSHLMQWKVQVSVIAVFLSFMVLVISMFVRVERQLRGNN